MGVQLDIDFGAYIIKLIGFELDLVMDNNPATIGDEIGKLLMFEPIGSHSIITKLSDKFVFERIEASGGT